MKNLHKIVDGHKVPLSKEEIEEFKEREKIHVLRLKEDALNQYKFDREQEQTKLEITDKKKIEALWEKIMRNDPQSANNIENILISINEKFSAPKGEK